MFIGAQIEDADRRARHIDREQHRIDAILNVEIGLALVAVTEDLDAGGIRLKLLIEVEHMAVGVPLAKDRHKAKDRCLKAETFAVGADQTFGSELRGTVQRRLNGHGAVFGCRKDRRLAVNRPR